MREEQRSSIKSNRTVAIVGKSLTVVMRVCDWAGLGRSKAQYRTLEADKDRESRDIRDSELA